MKPKQFEKFDKVMGGLLVVPYSKLQKKLEKEKEKEAKAKHKKKRPTSTASSAFPLFREGAILNDLTLSPSRISEHSCRLFSLTQ